MELNAETYLVYLRQSDRRWYPCIVLRDLLGPVAAYPAPVGRQATRVSRFELENMKSFRGAQHMRHKVAIHTAQMEGHWMTTHPQDRVYMLSRPDVPGGLHLWRQFSNFING